MPRFLFELTGSILYGYSSFRWTAYLYFCFLFVLLYCVSYLLSLGGGGGGVLDRWWGGGSRSPILAVFSGWSPGVGSP